jgi:alkylation response protein AidB-like acyl-CoA dehydrogenase
MSIDVMLSQEEISFREQFKAFLDGLDLSFILRMDKEDEKEFPKDFVRRLGQNNYLGIPLPKKVGGRGLNTVCAILAEEELGALAFPLGCAMGMSTYLCRAIYKYGSPELWTRYIIPTMKADMICAEGITEPLKGSDIARLQTSAKKQGNSYIITGEKRFQKGGIGADWFLTFARTNPDVAPHKGITAFIAERKHGVQVVEQFNLMGWRGMGASHLLFKDVAVPEENRVGKEGQGFEILMYLLQTERLMEAATALGSARECLKIAVRYSDAREQFEQKIREFQGISFKIAEMATTIDAGRLLCLRAAKVIDQEERRPNKEVAMAKFFSTEAAWNIIDQALQILGGIGYTDYYPIERFLRDVRVAKIYTGTNEIMRELTQRGVYEELLKANPSAGWKLWKGSKNLI